MTFRSNPGPRTLTRWRLIDATATQPKPYWEAMLVFKSEDSPRRHPLECDHERVKYNIGLAVWTCVLCGGAVYDSEERTQHTFVLDQGVSGEGW